MTIWAFDIETDVRATPHEDGTPAGLDPRVSAVTSIAIVGSDGSALVDTNLDPENEGALLFSFWKWTLRLALAAGDLLLESFADHHAMEGSP